MMTAEAMAKALGGRKVGNAWMARCPAHDDRTPSLSISVGDQGRVLVRCHAGCNQARVIAALRSRGLWANGDRLQSRFMRLERRREIIDPSPRNEDKRTENALSVWEASTTALGTPVETYLISRGLHLPPPPTLRFHAGLKHASGGIWPAMVALVTRGTDDAPLAIHRTFLIRDGSGKAPIDPPKAMLGPCRGGAVRLGDVDDTLLVGEGIETCLSAMQATGRPVWAALSTAGLRALELPEKIREVIVLADGDEPGEKAARDCALRWKREGRSMRIARPPRGLDFNDVLLGRAPRIEEDAA